MKKFLLRISVLAGTVVFCSSAFAGDLSVGVGGFIDFQSGFSGQNSAFETGANSSDLKFQNDTEIHINAKGQSNSGLKYGAVIELEADVTADADGEGVNADKTYIFIESTSGHVEFGNNSGAEANMAVNAAMIARATGGVDGDWYDFVNTGGTLGGSFILAPDLPSAEVGGIAEDATKVSYYTPRFSGLQIGLSFTPDTGNGGTALGFTSDTNGDNKDVFGIGINYTKQYDFVSLQASFTGEVGSAELDGIENLKAWAVGLVVDYQGFSVAGSWADLGKSGISTSTTLNDQKHWTLGTSYETGPFGISLTYLDSEKSDNVLTNLVVGADYQLAPGLVPYVEVSFFDLDETGTTTDNNGSVVLLGAELSF